MFKKTRLAQISLCCLALAGCAASQSTALQQPQHNSEIIVQSQSKEDSADNLVKAIDAHPKSGSSVSGRTDYFQADGSLSPYLQEWAEELAKLQSIPIASIEELLKSANYNAQAAQLMTPTNGRIKRSWSTYKNRFIEPIRLKAGLTFWQQHEAAINRSAQQYGIPPEIIVSIIGVETIYGNYTGDFKVLDALLTLGFSYPDNNRPERGQLFRDQLADLIVLHHMGKLNAKEVKGSFAGAMGLPQFMPGSLMRYAVDADGDGEIDLYKSIPDITASVANFLVEHGWQADLPVFAPVSLNPKQARPLVDGGLTPLLEWEQIKQAQAVNSIPNSKQAWMEQPLGVIDLAEQSQGTAEYRLATPNFFAITSYNRSYFYAATVADFAQLLRVEYTRR